jgi:Fe-Mn family superoxide dismutase
MAFELPPLSYSEDALAPHISGKTLGFHHGKHHRSYVKKLNGLIEGTPYEKAPLEEVIRQAWRDKEQAIFNNAAQTWNHTFYWSSMSPEGGSAPKGDVAAAIKRDFGSVDAFKEEFAKAGKGQFGSGWAWLVLADGKLEVRKTPNAETPLTDPKATPLLTMDVWEHAYYLDYQNRRPDYITSFLDHLVSWDFANENLARAS